MVGISLFSYVYLKLAKMLCLSYYRICFLFNNIREQKGWNRFCLEVGGVGCMAQTTYTHVSKCKNDKINKKEIIHNGYLKLVDVTLKSIGLFYNLNESIIDA
jgi:hypothetical protein